MAVLTVLLGGATLGGLSAAGQSERREETVAVKRIVVEEALRTGFPPSLALAVADAASGFNSKAQGRNGERGVMQLRPSTARHLGLRNDRDLWDARLNTRLGIAYLAKLLQAERGALAPALARMAHGLPPEGPMGTAPAPESPFVERAVRLQEIYQKESALWVAVLKGASVDWTLLRPRDKGLRDLAAAARRLEPQVQAPATAIEQRRRAVRPYLDDFSS